MSILDEFSLQFNLPLSADNRWVKLSKFIPWEQIEERYASIFADKGSPAKNIRIALGALLIKEKGNFSDRETVQQIIENPYLRYFLGFHSYLHKAPFDASMMVHFRKRLSKYMSEINELICLGKVATGQAV